MIRRLFASVLYSPTACDAGSRNDSAVLSASESQVTGIDDSDNEANGNTPNASGSDRMTKSQQHSQHMPWRLNVKHDLILHNRRVNGLASSEICATRTTLAWSCKHEDL